MCVCVYSVGHRLKDFGTPNKKIYICLKLKHYNFKDVIENILKKSVRRL